MRGTMKAKYLRAANALLASLAPEGPAAAAVMMKSPRKYLRILYSRTGRNAAAMRGGSPRT